jgi:hypothetical protein
MSSIKQNALRNVAEYDLKARFGDLEPQVQQEMATSLVRQWLTLDGYAGLVAQTHNFWFRMIRNDSGGYEVGCEQQTSYLLDALRACNVREEEFPALLHDLCICQSAVCQTADGRRIRIRILPKEKVVKIEPVASEEE